MGAGASTGLSENDPNATHDVSVLPRSLSAVQLSKRKFSSASITSQEEDLFYMEPEEIQQSSEDHDTSARQLREDLISYRMSPSGQNQTQPTSSSLSSVSSSQSPSSAVTNSQGSSGSSSQYQSSRQHEYPMSSSLPQRRKYSGLDSIQVPTEVSNGPSSPTQQHFSQSASIARPSSRCSLTAGDEYPLSYRATSPKLSVSLQNDSFMSGGYEKSTPPASQPSSLRPKRVFTSPSHNGGAATCGSPVVSLQKSPHRVNSSQSHNSAPSTPVVKRRGRAHSMAIGSVTKYNATQTGLNPLKITPRRRLPSQSQVLRQSLVGNTGSPMSADQTINGNTTIRSPHLYSQHPMTTSSSNSSLTSPQPTTPDKNSSLSSSFHQMRREDSSFSFPNQSFQEDQTSSSSRKRKKLSRIQTLQKKGRSQSICMGASNEERGLSRSLPHKLSPLYHPLHHKEVKTTKHVSKGVDDQGRKTVNQYSFMHQIGSGVSSKVKLCINWETGEECAIKVINRSLMKSVNHGLRRVSHKGVSYESIRREIAILKKVRHPNIVRVIEVIDDPTADKMYIVLEHVKGGELLKLDSTGNVVPQATQTSQRLFVKQPTSEPKDVLSAPSGMTHHPFDDESPPAMCSSTTENERMEGPSIDIIDEETFQQAQNDSDEITDDSIEETLSRHSSMGSYPGSPLVSSSFGGSNSDLSSSFRANQRSHDYPTSPSRHRTLQQSSSSSSLKLSKLAPIKIPKTPEYEPTNSGSATSTPINDDQTFMRRRSSLVEEECADLESSRFAPDGTIPEPTARMYFRDLISALHYLHKNNIVHRDIKPENMLIETRTNTLKLSDFGVSQFTDGEDDSFDDTTGTPAFYPPESCKIGRTYGRAADVWACGVTLYIMLFGKLPFQASSSHPGARLYSLFKSIEKEEAPLPDDLSDELRDLFCRLLEKNPDKRITTEELLKHPWVSKDQTVEDGGQNSDEDVAVDEEDLSRAITIQNHFKILDKVFYKIKDNWRKLRTPRSPLNTLRQVNILKPLSLGGSSNNTSPTGSSPPRSPNSEHGGPSALSSSQRALFSGTKVRNRSRSMFSRPNNSSIPVKIPERM